MLASSVLDTRLTLRVKSALVRTVRPNLLRLRHQRQLRLIPVVYRHATVSRQDAFLVSYPKSGNTWLVSLLSDYARLKPIDPWTDIESSGVGMCHLAFSEQIAARHARAAAGCAWSTARTSS